MAAPQERDVALIEYDCKTGDRKCFLCKLWCSYNEINLADMICYNCCKDEKAPVVRKKVSADTRRLLEKLTFGIASTAKCGINGCENTIAREGTMKYVIGHDKAVAHSGDNVVENLRLICAACNTNQRTMTFAEFEEKLKEDQLLKEPDTRPHIRRFLEKHCSEHGKIITTELFQSYTRLYVNTFEQYELDESRFIDTVRQLRPNIKRESDGVLSGISMRQIAMNKRTAFGIEIDSFKY